MNDKFKDMALFVIIVIAIIGFIFAISISIKANSYKNNFEKEMAFRLDMEEKVTKLRTERIDLTTALKDRELEIKKKDNLIESLNQEIVKNNTEIQSFRVKIKDLQVELEKVNLLKEKIEDNLKEELSKQVQEPK